MKNLSHKFLVGKSSLWLRNKCGIVLSELKTCTKYGEIPDVIGFGSGKTILLEIKTSLSDFRADQKKVFRKYCEGIGDFRFYIAEPEVIPHDEIPKGWGLYEFYNNKFFHKSGIKYSNCGTPPFTSCKESEIAMLKSTIFRIGQNGFDGLRGNFYTYETKNTESISVGFQEKDK